MKTGFVCRLPKCGGVAGERETNGSMGIRITAFVAALLLGISGILALCRVAPFSNLGPRFGWSAIALAAALLISSGLLKQIKKSSEVIRESHPVVLEERPTEQPSNVEENSASVEENPVLSKEERGSETASRTRVGPLDSGQISFVKGDQKLVYYVEGNKLIIGTLDPEAQGFIQPNVTLEIDKEVRSIAIKGDMIAVQFHTEITVWSCTTKKKVFEFTSPCGAIEDFFLDESNLVVTYYAYSNDPEADNIKDARGLEKFSLDLQKQSSPLKLNSKHFYLINHKYAIDHTYKAQHFLIDLEQDGTRVLMLAGGDRYFSDFIMHKNLIICCSPIHAKNTSIFIFSSEDGRFLKEIRSKDHFVGYRMQIEGENLEVRGKMMKEFEEPKQEVWKISLDL